ncbi:MAG: rolling circle replication-associated protein, partial [Minisyncoccia bacterium]
MLSIDFLKLKERNDFERKKKIRLLTFEMNKLVKSGRYRALAITLTFEEQDFYLDFLKKGGIRWLLNDLTSYIKREYNRRDFFYLWILEMQRRGVPHYHILLIVPKHIRIPYLDKWVFSFGMTNIKELKNFGSNYLLKYFYANKDYQQDFRRLREFLRSIGLKIRT